ncbi:MAG TPA: hypothetical protein ENI46_02460 [Firmicutes bacterium]|nr:hypothetical protein [Bacillota bacterium]
MKQYMLAIGMLLAICLASYAAEPSGTPREETPQSKGITNIETGSPLPFPEQMIAGQGTDSSGNPLGGVFVKLFADGRLIQSTTTTSSGSYELRLPVNIDKDETVVLWFLPATDNLLPKNVVLKKSSAARKANLFSPCTEEVRIRPQMRVDVKLVNESEYLSSLKVKNCF